MELVETILIFSLTISALASIFICYQVYYHKNKKYLKRFSNWQMPMIVAILIDMVHNI
jgi:hypothetical protein